MVWLLNKRLPPGNNPFHLNQLLIRSQYHLTFIIPTSAIHPGTSDRSQNSIPRSSAFTRCRSFRLLSAHSYNTPNPLTGVPHLQSPLNLLELAAQLYQLAILYQILDETSLHLITTG